MCTCAHVRVLVLMCKRVCVHINVALVRMPVRVPVRVPVRMCVHARACKHLSTGMSVCPYARRPHARVRTRVCKSTSTMMCTRAHSRS